MRKSHLAVTTVALLFVAVLAVTTLNAQQAPQQPPARPTVQATGTAAPAPGGIAVIDIAYILDKYSKMKVATDRFKADVEAAGKQLKAEQDRINQLGEKLKSLKAGSPEFAQLEATLAKETSDWKVNAALKDKEFAEREAKTFLAAYQEVSQAVQYYANKMGFTLVIRFNGNPPADQNNRDAVRAEVLKQVVFYDGRIDITPHVLQLLENNAAQPAAARGAPPRR